MLVSAATQHYPQLVAELNGTAVGSGQPLELILLANLLQEVSTALAQPLTDSPFRPIPDSCSDVLLNTPELSAFCHNEDYGTEFFDSIYFVRMNLEQHDGSHLQISTFCYPGILPGWAPGYNSRGLAFSWNVLYPSTTVHGGVAVSFVCRDALEASTIEEAITRASPSNLACGQNLNVGSFITKQLFTVETAPGGLRDVKLIQQGSGAYFHANKYLRLNTPQFDAPLVSSEHRLATFKATEPKPTSLGEMLGILGDVSDPIYPIFRRNDTTHEDTLFTIAFDLNSRDVTVFRGNPRLKESLLWKEKVLVDT